MARHPDPPKTVAGARLVDAAARSGSFVLGLALLIAILFLFLGGLG
jgi:hypothetical protein